MNLEVQKINPSDFLPPDAVRIETFTFHGVQTEGGIMSGLGKYSFEDNSASSEDYEFGKQVFPGNFSVHFNTSSIDIYIKVLKSENLKEQAYKVSSSFDYERRTIELPPAFREAMKLAADLFPDLSAFSNYMLAAVYAERVHYVDHVELNVHPEMLTSYVLERFDSETH